MCLKSQTTYKLTLKQFLKYLTNKSSQELYRGSMCLSIITDKVQNCEVLISNVLLISSNRRF